MYKLSYETALCITETSPSRVLEHCEKLHHCQATGRTSSTGWRQCSHLPMLTGQPQNPNLHWQQHWNANIVGSGRYLIKHHPSHRASNMLNSEFVPHTDLKSGTLPKESEPWLKNRSSAHWPNTNIIGYVEHKQSLKMYQGASNYWSLKPTDWR